MRRKCKDFMAWVKSQYDEFYAIIDKSMHLGVSVHGTSSSIIANITNDRTGKSGHASVKANKFDDPTIIVIGLAWADYKGEKIPDFTIPLCRLTTGDVFYYNGEKYRYLSSNPYASFKIIVCDAYGIPRNLDWSTKVSTELPR